MSLPANHKLTEAQIAELEHEDSFLRGTQALAILNEAIKETGIVIPTNYVFKDMDRSVIKKAHDAVFGLLGGVPSMLLWAAQNKGDFYKQYAKFGAVDTNAGGGATVIVNTNVAPSPLDNIVLTDDGKIVDAQYDDPLDDALEDL